MKIDTTFNFFTDSNGGDPDRSSPMLRSYHKLLWSKSLPSSKLFDLTDKENGVYLYHQSGLGEFRLGSDAITHSYLNHQRKASLIRQVQEEAKELFDAGSTIGAYILFPNNRIDGKHTINQARGVNSYIDDRFDLTLECIRLYYAGQQSPLYDTLDRYAGFFELFMDFKGYVNFFLLNDFVDGNDNIRFYLPFDDFKKRPEIKDADTYRAYKRGVMEFVQARNKRIADYASEQLGS